MNLDSQTIQVIEFLSDPRVSTIFLLLTVWALIWKGVALWKAGRNDHKRWFIAMLVINTFGILEIIYVFYFSKKKPPKPIT